MNDIQVFLRKHRRETYPLFRRYLELGKSLLLRTDVLDVYEEYTASLPSGSVLASDGFREFIERIQEAVIHEPEIALSVRPQVARWGHVQIQVEEMFAREISVSEFLRLKEQVADPASRNGDWRLEIDLTPFAREFPHMRETRSIGRGVEFLNRHLSNRLFERSGQGYRKLFDFLNLHQVRGRQLMLGNRLKNVEELRRALARAMDLLETQDETTGWTEVERRLRELGFEPGWGRDSKRILETMGLLSDILEAPSPQNLERFLRRIPMLFSIAVITPHGYFGQSGVLGKPDTGGQVVYILDQVRAVEAEMRRSIHNQGLDVEPRIVVLTRLIPEAEGTTVNQRIEPIAGTQNAFILRVPFRDAAGEVIPHWISRFKIWPYLERFAAESEKEIVAELDGHPDFIIGNYSDGNLVASLLAKRLGVTQCNIAHALEKTKYLHSDLYWRDHETDHHFACQYTADLISMNTADFIISSTYQEIAGTRNAVGQYESYDAFTMPGLYRVTGGINVFDPKFNIVAPGADAEIFFPYTQAERRITDLHEHLQELVFGRETGSEARGAIAEPDRPLLFAMSRLDHIKNMSGFLEWYARCPELRAEANLLLVGGHIDPARSLDLEERRQIERLHALFSEHGLDGQVRWVVMQSDKMLVGELYRFVADRRGAFVQPALFEAFGLTVVEAMSSGLPTFATCYGGPLEIIEQGVSGFHLDPNRGDEAAAAMARFFAESRQDPAVWDRISEGGIRRVEERYTWKLYARRLLGLSRIYGFWKFISNMEREESRAYLDMLYGLVYRPLAEKANGEPGR